MLAADFRRIARDAIYGRWGLVVLTAFVAGLLGGGFTGPNVNSHANVSNGSGISISVQSISENYPFLYYLAIGVVIWSLAFWVLGGVVELGYCRFRLNLLDGKPAALNDLFSQLGRFKDAICLRLATTLFIFLWSLLLVVPGIIAEYRYAMAPYIMAEMPGCTAGEALEYSADLMRGNKFRLFCLHLSFIGWHLLSALTLGIGYLWLKPYIAVAEAAFYRDISTPRAEQ